MGRADLDSWQLPLLPRHHKRAPRAIGGVPSQCYFRRFTPTQQSQAVNLMKRLNTACLMVPNVGSDGAPAFVARLIQRVLRSLSTRSTVPSRAVSPGLPSHPEVSEAVMTDLDEFLATITAPDLTTVDDQDWSTLFGDTLDYLPAISET
ncbi:hypothetical protein CC85DRAFT_287293 [Cutaneotrichosporon oleaginosum]|uniref:Uncharacterized protein n=1 Tax=Cutaneotrichosporon oleaginosum TaxID=879819 RepID=A0A0J0XHM5_9TREE|nr:uncharacterized protein CC85DRAFT_287293 [Cutaneotrichosporon oleaginosum]KLT40568.1 hypothetical protein CC85DRAFT_287293 [Cutaneotrichosporon oleaginosum]